MAFDFRSEDTLSARLRRRDTGTRSDPTFQVGLIKDTYAHTGCYLVGLPAGRTIVATEALPMFSGIPMGARPVGMYMPGARVVVAQFPQVEYGLILGTSLKQVSDARVVLPDSIGRPRLDVGVKSDNMHYGPLQDYDTPGNFSVGRPLDTLPGDWGSINDMGVGVLVGRMMALLRASDLAKIEAFWGDDLLRIFGYNMEISTAATEEQRVNDEGEYNEILFKTPYPWEGLGSRGGPGGTSTTDDAPAKKGSVKATVEPEEDDQHILPRFTRLTGYLGDMEREWISAPPSELELETFKGLTRHTGLYEQVKSIDGSYALRSAREIMLEKTILIPVPKQMTSSEDPTGDNRENYSASGLFNGTHEKKPYFWGEDKAGIRSAQMLDYHTWFFNRYTPVGLNKHELDWYYPEESGGALGDGTLYTGGYNNGHEFLMELPQIADITIDHRSGNIQKYYRSRSAFHMHDDGSLTIEDGYGSQIVMAGGSISLKAFNDVFLQPGRSMVCWAPYDAIVRAGNCADVSAALGDVRLKAERNLQILGGNSKSDGGVLIESRSTGPQTASDFGEKTGARVTSHGITIKSAASPVYVVGSEVYVGRYAEGAGSVIIDGGDQGRVLTRGAQILTRSTDVISQTVVAPGDGPEEEMFALNLNGALLSTNIDIGGSIRTSPSGTGKTGDAVIGGQILCHGLGVFGDNVLTNGQMAQREGSNFVASIERDIDLGTEPSEIAAKLNRQVEAVREVIDELNDEAVEEAETSPGNKEFQDSIGASMRATEEDLKLGDSFIIYESRWQQVMRANGNASTWNEPVVEAPSGEPTRPHPGEAAWEEGDHYATVDPLNLSLSENKTLERENMQNEGAEPELATLAEGYLINTQT